LCPESSRKIVERKPVPQISQEAKGNFEELTLKTAIIIPARLQSTRLPRKMLLAETGKPLIQHTLEAARRCRLADRVLVAADDPEIVEAVRRCGGEAVLTDPAHISGTDRIAEASAAVPECELIVNLQGDEPEMNPAAVDRSIELLRNSPEADVATVVCPIRERALLEDPACVKVVCRRDGRALYFSRSPIPHARTWREELLQQEPPLFLQHLGLYVYRRDFLLGYSRLPASALETTEMLEQLRVLQAGGEIVVAVVEKQVKGIDTPEDYRGFVSRLGKC
jgi:3-deoxy-manno-octulosonate cytidylyltransferase (CMP-KDO synthetase)